MTTPTVYLQELHKIIDTSYHEANIYYTDGSKHQDGVGAAYYNIVSSSSFKLNNNVSVISSELIAIREAVTHITTLPPGRYLICSDSQSGLLMLKALYSNHPTVLQIQCILKSSPEVKVDFLWVPGHVGIDGNERADAMAKDAAQAESVPLDNNISPDDLKALLYGKVRENKNADWFLTPFTNKLRNVKTTALKWPQQNVLNRRESVVLTRIRIGHSFLTHGYLMVREIEPMCQTCNVTLSIKHIIEECPAFDRQRSVHNVRSIKQSAGDRNNNIYIYKIAS